MSLQYQLVFGLLVTELSIFFLLLIIPRSWYHFDSCSNSYWFFIISFIFTLKNSFSYF